MSFIATAVMVAKISLVPAVGGGVIVKADEIGEGSLYAYSMALAGRKIVTANGGFQVACSTEKKVTHCEFNYGLPTDSNYSLKFYSTQKYLSGALYPPYSQEYAAHFAGPNQEVLLQFEAQNGWLIIHGRQGVVVSMKAIEKEI